jgi:hypothetical protein
LDQIKILLALILNYMTDTNRFIDAFALEQILRPLFKQFMKLVAFKYEFYYRNVTDKEENYNKKNAS